MSKHLVVYHANCNDGTVAAAVVVKWLKEKHSVGMNDIILIPCQYSNETDNEFYKVKEQLTGATFVTIVDFSFPEQCIREIIARGSNYEMFDHHKSALPLANIPGCYINEDNSMSGAMWVAHHLLPELCEDRLVKHVDDYDRWQFKLAGTKAFAAGLKHLRMPPEILAGKFGDKYFYDEILDMGFTIMGYESRQIDSLTERSLAKPIWCTVPVGNSICGIAVNSSYYDIHSSLGSAINEQAYAYFDKYNSYPLYCAIWQLTDPDHISVSLRANEAQVKIMTNRYGEDCSTIAKRFGGGGHDGAASFRISPAQWFAWLDEVKVTGAIKDGVTKKGGDGE